MTKTAKIIITIVAIVLFFLLFSTIVSARQSAGAKTPGLLGLILFAGLIGALRAVWKKPKNNNSDDSSSLQQ